MRLAVNPTASINLDGSHASTVRGYILGPSGMALRFNLLWQSCTILSDEIVGALKSDTLLYPLLADIYPHHVTERAALWDCPIPGYNRH